MSATTPTPAPLVQPEPDMDGAALLDEVREAMSRYIILPSDEAMIGVVLWIAATHAVPAWTHATRLVIWAPEKACGKSRLMQLIRALCHRELMAVNVSSSAVYRAISGAKSDPPTLLLDEADTVFGAKASGDEDLRGLLNGGFERDAYALRYNAAKDDLDKLSTFSMAALAGIGRMPATIEDRAVVISMRRRKPGETVAPYRKRRDGEPLDRLRVRLNRWARANMRALELATPDMPIEDRPADLWEPLIAVADQAGGHWPDAARKAAVKLTNARDETAKASETTQLLRDIRAAFDDAHAEAMPSAVLLARLNTDEEAPWADYGPKGLTGHRLAAMLREYDIRARVLNQSGGQKRGYHRADFADTWERYCPTNPETGTGTQVSEVSERQPDTETPSQTH
ncbi:DUF3631 domain-containing protein [Myceligenerans salitolerans]|uniref:DUF3631 domain-containing protein n=1 Tax=Myceligenerans salitolerans TaxID=1230528 RepID=A0ABS3I8N3_9MICO|nr:DUF3631 domain-containing protein [Myceligenerans salitolerans]MBO0609381.1 DUF3631 domain-containing protein [Myceligenerans salitolerans]